MSELKELWNAIGNKKEKEFWKKYPDFEFTEEMFDKTLDWVSRPIDISILDKKKKEEE